MKRNRKYTATYVFGWMQWCMFILCVELAPVFSAHAVSTLPGEECKVQPHHAWTEQEQWTWQQICMGNKADLAKHYGGSYLPKEAEKWPKQRTLTPQFLETLLFYEPWSSSIPKQGINIIGAKFNNPKNTSINLENASLQVSLLLGNCYIAGINLHNANIGGQLSMEGATVDGILNLESATVNKTVFLQDAHIGEIRLVSANIGGQLIMQDITVKYGLNMEAATVKKSVLLQNAHFGEIRLFYANICGQMSMKGDHVFMDAATVEKSISLLNANIGGQLSMEGAIVCGKLDMDAATVEKSVFIQNAHLQEMNLGYVNIGGQLNMMCTTVDGILNLESAIVKNNVFFSGASLQQKANLLYLSIGGNLDLSNGNFKALMDLSGSHITNDLILGTGTGDFKKPPSWNKDYPFKKPQLILRNVSVSGVQDGENPSDFCKVNTDSYCNAWPANMVLNGFKFTQLGALDFRPNDISKRSSDWWKKWLNRNQFFSPQPYQVVASVLQTMGRANDANEILYAGKNAERDSIGFPRNIFLWLQWALIGYGCFMLRSILWIIGFVCFGVWIMRWSGEAKKVTAYPLPKGLYQHKICKRDRIIYWSDLIAYSFDMLLPIIKLREAHSNIDLQGGARYYFYFHRMMGWVLGAFLVAGISGLTK
jgi:uncharacterized protein YjbI with pentapeptide repeats